MLQIEAGRKNHVNGRLCISCKELYIIVLEDECHFLMLFPAYAELRSNYTSYSSFIEIPIETEEHKIMKLASFVYHTEKLIQRNLTNMYWYVLHKCVLCLFESLMHLCMYITCEIVLYYGPKALQKYYYYYHYH